MKFNVKTHLPPALATVMLLASVWCVPHAFADEQFRTEKVKFPDLNVESPEGVQILYGRIHAAAKRVCSIDDPSIREGMPACIRKAEADAIEKLNLSQLTAYYKSKSNGGSHPQPLVAAR